MLLMSSVVSMRFVVSESPNPQAIVPKVMETLENDSFATTFRRLDFLLYCVISSCIALYQTRREERL